MAKEGLELIKAAIITHLRSCSEGSTNAEIAENLGLQSDHQGANRNYLTYSALGILLRDGLIQKKKDGARTLYVAAAVPPVRST